MRPRWLRRRLRDDRGVSMLEFAGFLPILLVIGMAAIQLGLMGRDQPGGDGGAGGGTGNWREGDDAGTAAGHAAVSRLAQAERDARQASTSPRRRSP